MLELRLLPAFNDNYFWVFGQRGSAQVCVVDPGDASPVLRYLQEQKLTLEAILLTHHHADHIGGVQDLLDHALVPVYGPRSSRMPCVSHVVGAGDTVTFAATRFEVLHVPGHTLDHIAWFSPASEHAREPILFCGDTLFGAGCGRMFEGTPPVMQASLQQLANLPPATRVCCAHEYTLSNLRFAAAVMPGNAAVKQRSVRDQALRDAGSPTLPSQLADELATNPFLRCGEPEVVAAVQRHAPGSGSDPASVFGVLRRWKDTF
jgi:hydroxyacylglutathione hydrolase